MRKDFPKDSFGWEVQIDGKVKYTSENIISIEIKHYTHNGCAHGYLGMRSLLFSPLTGKTILQIQLFKDRKLLRKTAQRQWSISKGRKAEKELTILN